MRGRELSPIMLAGQQGEAAGLCYHLCNEGEGGTGQVSVLHRSGQPRCSLRAMLNPTLSPMF